MPRPEARLTALDYVKAVDVYVATSFLLKTISVSIADGINVDQAKTAALIRSTNELSEVIRKVSGRSPMDVGEEFTFRNLHYDGTQVLAPVEEVRKAVRQALLHPQTFADYEKACIFYYWSRHGHCIVPAEQTEAESVA